jgi:ABC-2 type transport system ATP-binding protein
MIEIDNLTKKFGVVTAVENLTLHVDEGEVFGLLGPNGAGKTTTIRMLGCLISTTSGDAQLNGLSISDPQNYLTIRKMIGLLPENVGLYEDISAYKNLDFFGKLYDCPKHTRNERIEYFLKQMDLWDKKDMLVGTFSKGMKQKLAIARALIHDPDILFLDEPTANLDPEATKMVRDIIIELKKEKRTIFINTHMLDEADRICDRVGILNTQLITVGTPQELRSSLWAKKTVVELDTVTEAIVTSIKELGYPEIEIDQNQLKIKVEDPHKANPKILAAIQAAGGAVVSITEVLPSLEEVYLKKIKRGG